MWDLATIERWKGFEEDCMGEDYLKTAGWTEGIIDR